MNIQVAIALYMQAQYSQAKTIYQNILTVEPRNADALHLLGVVAYQTEDYLEAVELIEKASLIPTCLVFLLEISQLGGRSRIQAARPGLQIQTILAE